jgi:hypothetical protein
VIDERCFRDGAYGRDRRTGDLVRCLGEREINGETRFGFEDAVYPAYVRWVKKTGVLANRLRFVKQGEPSSPREVVEAMR